MSNNRAEAWLKELGYSPQPEPDWVTGRKPDFFCPGCPPLWVEVKTFEPSQYSQVRDRAWRDFRSRVAKIREATGEVYAMTSQTYSEAHGKVAARLLRQLAKSPPPSSNDVNEVIVIPPDPVPHATITIRYQSRAGEVLQIGPRSVSGRYGYYPSYDPKNWSQEIDMYCAGERSERRELYDVFHGDNDGPISLVYCRSKLPLSLPGLMTTGGFNTTAARIREALDDANDQLRSGQNCVVAPGICVIYHDSLDATSGHMFLAALFGDLTIPITLNPTSPGIPFLGRNGILSPMKNRSISAVRYVGLAESVVLNPYARHPIVPDLFRSPVWTLEGETLTLRHFDPASSSG